MTERSSPATPTAAPPRPVRAHPSSSSSPSTPRATPRSPSKTHRSLRPPPPPATITQEVGCFVSADARLEGSISLGAGCVLHPRCSVRVAPGASVHLADGCVVEEEAVVTFSGKGAARVGAHTVFMVACRVDLVAGDAVGPWCSFMPRSRLAGVRLGERCTLAAGTSVDVAHPALRADLGGAEDVPQLPDRTIIHGAANAARTWDAGGEAQETVLRLSATEYLRDVLPKFNKQRAA
ncbi:uncharacterized protein LOC62_03G004396 [Vanrija pseudolonga]|uniref:Dynactin subunit 6 n=1 Tax=Vanrija pseudolonga TaxID=143232 RepID=A0AAF0Y9Y2_9TREE|nr:hypothetical protein LOC62_03G004396 [Vanrija pseudolonga]